MDSLIRKHLDLVSERLLMTKLVDLQEFKDKKLDEEQEKKFEKIAEDLKLAIQVMDLSIRGLTPFLKYVQVMESVSCLQNNKTLLEIHLRKYQKLKDERPV